MVAIKQSAISEKDKEKLKNVFDRMDQPELRYDHLKYDVKRIMDDPKATPSILKKRLQRMDRESLIALVSNNQKVDREQAERVVDKIEQGRDEVLKKMNETKDIHSAEKPIQLSWKGWKQIGKRVNSELTIDHIAIVSAGVAYYFFLALFPTFIAAISIFGLVMEPAQIQQQISEVAHILPQQSSQMISDILEDITSKSEATLGWSLVLSVLFSLWSAQQGTKAVFEGINVAYNEIDERGFFKYNGLTLLFTLGGIVIGIICTALVVVFPAIIEGINLPAYGVESIVQWLRWPVLALILMGVLAITYKIAPDRRNPEFSWVSWGAVIATILWLAGSILFSFYISNFGNYDKMYGSFAAVIILMLWFFITAYIILLGAEINSEMEHQTRKDTTIGKDRPMGERNAFHADHVAD